MVGKETVCIFCLTRCSTREKRPQLLTCLHSACLDCFNESAESCVKGAIERKPNPTAKNVKDESSGEGDDDCCEVVEECNEPQVAVVPCPLCKVSTTDDEIKDNLFLQVQYACFYNM